MRKWLFRCGAILSPAQSFFSVTAFTYKMLQGQYVLLCLKTLNSWSKRCQRSIYNSYRTERSPIRSVIIRAKNKIGRPQSGSPIVNHQYNNRRNWTTRGPNLTNFEKETRHGLYVFIKKKKNKQTKKQQHCPITSMTLTLSYLCLNWAGDNQSRSKNYEK